jgi:HAE1 family hydrophobic/amphiphilic exporter-1
LVGAAVNTSIVMVDLANQLRDEGKSVRDAIVGATLIRARPILVTTASNILGLVPMLFTGSEPGGSLQLPLAATLIGGLLSSTILTLIFVPLVYVTFSRKNETKSSC